MNEQKSENYEKNDFYFENNEKIRKVLGQSLLKQEKFLNIFKNSLIKLNDKEKSKTTQIIKLIVIYIIYLNFIYDMLNIRRIDKRIRNYFL